jgi:hypothetical protein
LEKQSQIPHPLGLGGRKKGTHSGHTKGEDRLEQRKILIFSTNKQWAVAELNRRHTDFQSGAPVVSALMKKG